MCANDPAARSALEVALVYPGLHALWLHRVAHALWTDDIKLGARVAAPRATASSPGSRSTPAAHIGRRGRHRPRHGHRHRRDGDGRRRVPPLQGRRARRHLARAQGAPPAARRRTWSSARTRASWARSTSANTRASARAAWWCSEVPPEATVVGVPGARHRPEARALRRGARPREPPRPGDRHDPRARRAERAPARAVARPREASSASHDERAAVHLPYDGEELPRADGG